MERSSARSFTSLGCLLRVQRSWLKRMTSVNSQAMCMQELAKEDHKREAWRRRADHSGGSRLDAVLPRVRATPECVVAMAIVVAQDAVEHATRAYGRRGGSERQQGRRGRQGAPHAKLDTQTQAQRANKLNTCAHSSDAPALGLIVCCA